MFYMISLLEEHGKKLLINKGVYLCREGFELNYAFFILSGTCKVTKQEENGNIMSFGFYNNTGFIGDLETIRESNIALTSVVTITLVECIKIPLVKSKQLAKTNIEYCNLIASNLAKKLSASSDQSTQNILLPLEDRLIIYLKNTYPNKKFIGNFIQISQELGTSYRHFLRTVKKLKDEKILVPTQNKKEYLINL